MKAMLFFIPAILALACGSAAEENQDTEVDEVEIEVVEVVETAETIDDEKIEDVTLEEEEGEELPDVDLYTLGRGRVGLFTTIINAEEAREIGNFYPDASMEDIEVMMEGMAYPVLQMTFGDSGHIILELDANESVYRIEVVSDLFVTPEGISIGSTWAELEAAYEFEGLSWGNEGNPVAILEEDGMTFVIQPGDWWVNGEVQGDIPEETAVIKAFVW